MNSLTIGVVAYNYKLSCNAIKELAHNDETSTPRKLSMGYCEMQDGTIYKCFSTEEKTRGLRIDQIILVDDDRWEVDWQQFELIDSLKHRMYMSYVPDEFQIQRYEWWNKK